MFELIEHGYVKRVLPLKTLHFLRKKSPQRRQYAQTILGQATNPQHPISSDLGSAPE